MPDLARRAVQMTGWPLLLLTLETLGIIYGDIGTSPLYTVNAIFPAANGPPSEEDVVGGISAIFWAFTLVPVVKYCFFCLYFGTAEGEGGAFALFCGLYPNLNPTLSDGDHELNLTMSTYPTKASTRTSKEGLLHRYGWIKWVLLTWTLLGTSLTLTDGILTPAISVVSAVQGIAVAQPSVLHSVTPISIAILIVLFAIQRLGTGRLGKLFGPIILIWLALLGGTGIYNITLHPAIFRALDPSRAILYFVRTGNFDALGGILLSITGVEALFANLGQFNVASIRLGLVAYAYPCLQLAYFGQGAAIISNGEDVIQQVFYRSIPGPRGGGLYWIIFVFAILATIVASQAMISGCFSLVQQLVHMKASVFPSVKIIHTSHVSQGKIYIPSINYILGIAVIAVVGGFQTSSGLTHAYGFGIATVMLVTTFLVSLQIYFVKGWHWIFAIAFYVFFTFIDCLWFGSTVTKVPNGAWFPLGAGLLLESLMLLWFWGKTMEADFDRRGRMRLNALFSFEGDRKRTTDEKLDLATPQSLQDDEVQPVTDELENEEEEGTSHSTIAQSGQAVYLSGPDGSTVLVHRSSSIAFFYKATGGKGAPHAFVHFMRHYPTLPKVVIFVTIKTLPKATVPDEERMNINRVRSFSGFYSVSLFFGFKQTVDLSVASNQIVDRITSMEKVFAMNGEIPVDITEAGKVRSHILPGYRVHARVAHSGNIFRTGTQIARKFLLEELYHRVAVNFPEEEEYFNDAAIGEGGLLRLSINAYL
ncbi:potassium transporter [Atractiella rhizophila]|nr:potassium transporter [Atractiella rhizophila]